MKIIKKSVKEELLHSCNQEIDALLSQRVWSSNQATWDEGLFVDNLGMCLSAGITFFLERELKKELHNYLPPYDKLTINYNVWLKNSGIRWHSDANYAFGATLYLNEWDKKWGGLFLWEDKEIKLHALCPEPGMLVINTEAESHSVTQVSNTAPYPRRSLQIWGTML
jgi:2OG-Fe(II) oxygenase superfamily